MVRFVISYNNEHLKTYEISEPVITVGRLPENTISIANMGVSRRHLRIECDADNRYILTDLNSLNGTYVNNKRMKTVALASGDFLSIGKYSILFEIVNGDAPAPAAPAEAEVPAAEETVGPAVETPPSASNEVLDEVSDDTDAPPVSRDTVDDLPVPAAVLIETTKHVVYKLEKPVITIGNADTDDIFVAGFMVGDGHVAVEKRDDGIWLSVRKPMGKVKVNGKTVKAHRLEHKDRIEVGKSTFRYMENE
jgi:pSer/pThr/pTyr-binding forkhead associated (FHA) protein